MNKKLFYIFLIIFFLVILGIIFYFQKKDIDKNSEQKNEQTQIEKENVEESNDILKKVNKLFVAPEEIPIISRIADINQPALQQAFFTGAQNGDYLLIYKDAGKAVLYSEIKNKIINMGPFNAGK